MDTTNCPNALPQLQADKVAETPVTINTKYQNPFVNPQNVASSAENTEVITWLGNMEKQLMDQLHKTVAINSTINKHEVTLNKAEQALGTYESNFTTIFRMLRYLEELIREQNEVSRNLDNKLSGIMLDVVEVNNVLSKKIPVTGDKLIDKAIQVQSIPQVRTCPSSPEVVKFKGMYSSNVAVICNQLQGHGQQLFSINSPFYMPQTSDTMFFVKLPTKSQLKS